MYTSFHNVGGIGMMYGAAGKRIEKSTLSLSLQSLLPPTYPSRAPPPFRVRELPGFAGWRNEMCEAQKSIAQDQERERERDEEKIVRINLSSQLDLFRIGSPIFYPPLTTHNHKRDNTLYTTSDSPSGLQQC